MNSAKALERWRTFLEDERGRVTLASVGAEDVAAYPAWRRPRLTKAGDGVASINRDIAAFKALCGFLVRTRRLARSPAAGVELGREHRNTERIVIVSSADFERVVGKLEKLEPHWADCAVALLGTGMRWSSLHRARLEDVDLERRAVKLPRTKGKRGVDLVVPQRAVEALGRAIGRGVASDSGGFNEAIQRAAEALGVRRWTAHHLRHTAAVGWLRAGADVRQVQAWLGHQSIETTQRYLHFVQGAEVPALV